MGLATHVLGMPLYGKLSNARKKVQFNIYLMSIGHQFKLGTLNILRETWESAPTWLGGWDLAFLSHRRHFDELGPVKGGNAVGWSAEA